MIITQTQLIRLKFAKVKRVFAHYFAILLKANYCLFIPNVSPLIGLLLHSFRTRQINNLEMFFCRSHFLSLLLLKLFLAIRAPKYLHVAIKFCLNLLQIIFFCSQHVIFAMDFFCLWKLRNSSLALDGRGWPFSSKCLPKRKRERSYWTPKFVATRTE